jgi:hypothetical protein
MWGGFVGPIMSYIVGIAVTYFLLKKGSAKMPDKWTWKSILYELTFCNVMEMQEQFSVDVVCYTSTCWACVLWQLIPYLLLICFINLARSDNQECQSFFGNYADFVSWPFQVLGILCVACAAFLFLVALATPKANEDFVTLLSMVNSIRWNSLQQLTVKLGTKMMRRNLWTRWKV